MPDWLPRWCRRLTAALAGEQGCTARNVRDVADLTAALTLMPRVRAEIDQIEAALLMITRARGMTWQEIAFGLGLGSAQAARQRYERLAVRTAPDHASEGS